MLPWIIEREGASTHDVVERFGYANTAELVKDLHLVFMTGLPGYGPGDLIDVDIFEDEVFVDAAASLEMVATGGLLARPLAQRLPFRELGLSIGLHAILLAEAAPASRSLGPLVLDAVRRHGELASAIEATWSAPTARRTATWTEHEDINAVMLATSLQPEGFLG